jgi:hypothetical protein
VGAGAQAEGEAAAAGLGEHRGQRSGKKAACENILWAPINTQEFLFNR